MSKLRRSLKPLPATLRAGGAKAVPVTVTPYGDRLVVRSDDDVIGVPMRSLRRDSTIPARPTIYRSDERDWSLVIEHVDEDSWVNGIPEQMNFPFRLFAIVGVAAALGAGAWSQREDIVVAAAPLLPHGVTDPIGRSYLAELGRPCDGGPGSAALTRLTARLLPQSLPEPVSVTVVDTPEVNAVALPGGHVALFRGLVEQAQSADEIAAALAHEIEHIAHQHPNQAILRASGPAVAARVLGSEAGQLADLTVLKKGDLAAEIEADDGAIALLKAAEVSTEGAADFFARQAGGGGFNSSHPSDAARAKRFAAAARSGTDPALSEADWQALQAICKT